MSCWYSSHVTLADTVTFGVGLRFRFSVSIGTRFPNRSLMYFRLYDIIFCFIVRVVSLQEPLPCSLLVGFHLLLAMTVHFLMSFNMTGNAQQADVVRVIAEAFHLLHRSPTFHGHDVVAVNTWRYESLLTASLAEPVGTSPHNRLSNVPSFMVQQSLVVLVPAHGSTSNGLNPSYSKPSSALPWCSPSASLGS